MKLTKRHIIYILITLGLMVFIFVQSALPADLSQNESNFLVPFFVKVFHVLPDTASFIIRKSAHFLEYTALGLILTLTVRSLWFSASEAKNGNVSSRAEVLSAILSFVIGALYAATDEFHQMFVNGRSGELRDWSIDAGGVLLGVLIICLIQGIRKKRRTSV